MAHLFACNLNQFHRSISEIYTGSGTHLCADVLPTIRTLDDMLDDRIFRGIPVETCHEIKSRAYTDKVQNLVEKCTVDSVDMKLLKFRV